MNGFLGVAWAALIVGGIIAAGEIVQAQAPADPLARLGPEAWIILAGVLVTVGVNLEQLRRVRADVKDLKRDGDDKHRDNTGRLDSVDRRLSSVERTLRHHGEPA